MESEWSKHQDPVTGKTYYYNRDTEETRWEEKDTVTIHVDKNTQRRYSYNTLTKETSWIQSNEQDSSGSLPNATNDTNTMDYGTSGVTVHVHGATGRRYSYNRETEETKWISDNDEASLENTELVDEIVTDSYEEAIAAHQEKLQDANDSELQVLVVSWNVGNAEPNDNELYSLLHPREDLQPDIIIFGAQECSYAKQKQKIDETSMASMTAADMAMRRSRSNTAILGEDKFFTSVQDALGTEYEVLEKVKLLEMKLVVCVRSELVADFSNIEKGVEATGVAHVVGNKGGLGIKIEYKGTSMVFLSCHLAAHMGHTEDRLSNVREIFRNLRFGNAKIEMTAQFDYLFLFGDLNFRIEKERMCKDWGISSDQCFDHVIDKIDKKEFESLYAYDQLCDAQKSVGFLSGFREGKYNFAPTFKVCRGVFGTEYNPQRIPSYCDRILWKSIHNNDDDYVTGDRRPRGNATNPLQTKHRDGDVVNGGGVDQIIFESCEHITTSDHKPVRSVFNLKVFPKMDVVNSSSSSAEEDVYIVEIFGLRAKCLRAFDKDGTSDPYFHVHMTPASAVDTFDGETLPNTPDNNNKVRRSWRKRLAMSQASKVCVSTSIVKNTLNPSWDTETYMFQTKLKHIRDLKRCHLIFVGYDWDAVGSHDKIGYCTFPLERCLANSQGDHDYNAHFSLQINKKGHKQKTERNSVLEGFVRVSRISEYYAHLDEDRGGTRHSTMGQKLHGWYSLSGNLPSMRRKSTHNALRDFYLRDNRRQSFGVTATSFLRTPVAGSTIEETLYNTDLPVPYSPMSADDTGYSEYTRLTASLEHIMILHEPVSYAGSLLKKGSGAGVFGNTTFKMRYFVLEQKSNHAMLSYYENDSFARAGKPTRRGKPIDLKYYKLEVDKSPTDLGLCLLPTTKAHNPNHRGDNEDINSQGTRRKYELRCPDEASKLAWLTILKRWVPFIVT